MSPLTLVTPHAWCDVVPTTMPGANGNARHAPRTRGLAGGARTTRPAVARAGADRSQAAVARSPSASPRPPSCWSPGRSSAGAPRAAAPRASPAAGPGSTGAGVARPPRPMPPAARTGGAGAARRPSSPTGPRRGRRTPPPISRGPRGAPQAPPSSAYSSGGAGMEATHAQAPSTNRRIIDRDGSVHRSASSAPIRWKPTVRANRSDASVRSENHSDRRPFAARSASSIWKSRSDACTNPARTRGRPGRRRTGRGSPSGPGAPRRARGVRRRRPRPPPGAGPPVRPPGTRRADRPRRRSLSVEHVAPRLE